MSEWCRLYSRKNIWQNLNAKVADPYGVETSKQKSDYNEAVLLENRLFPEICGLLNQYHHTNYDNRFWLIIVGPWLKKILRLLINRINTLKMCLDKFEISGTRAYESNISSLISSNYLSAIGCFRDDKWNNILNYKIINLLKDVKFSIDLINDKNNHNSFIDFEFSDYKLKTSTNYKSYKLKILEWSFKVYCKIAKRLIRKKDAFIINSYLPLFEEIKLELSLGQFPQLWGLQHRKLIWSLIKKKPDKILRDSLCKKLSNGSSNNLENIIRSLLFELLPVCYLEGFKDLVKIVNDQRWPKNPKFIFTSNSYDSDEIFKLWVAKQVNSGSKYYIGQHGCNYGVRWDNIDCIEEVTPDKFISWGWTDNSPKHLPAFLWKSSGQKKLNYTSNGGLLLIETTIWNRFTTWDSSKPFFEYLNDQKKFIKNLSESSRQKLTIRLHPLSEYGIWDEEKRWLDFDPKLKIDKGKSKITKLISENRIVIHTYESTSMLETLSQNIPTLIFYKNGLDDLRKSALPYYKALIDEGIIHLSAESAAKKVNEIWDDIDSWWFKSNTQKARKQFCDRYAKTSQNPISEIKNILLS